LIILKNKQVFLTIKCTLFVKYVSVYVCVFF